MAKQHHQDASISPNDEGLDGIDRSKLTRLAEQYERSDAHGSPELDEDAHKLAAMGQDPGPTLQDLAPATGTAVAERDDIMALYAEAAGEGFEDVRASDLALPQFKLLQSGSPQVKRSEAAYVPGAEEGLWLDVISNRLFREITFVPCKFATLFIEWDGAKLGRLIANHGTDRSVMERTHRDEKFGLDKTPEGTVIVPTATWFGLVIRGVEKTPEGDNHINSQTRGVVSMASTAQKVSKRWVTDADSLLLQHPDGSFFKPPLFAMSYTLTTSSTKNDKGSWYLPVVNRAGLIRDLPNGRSIFDAARAFRNLVAESSAQTIIMNADDAPSADEAEGARRTESYADKRIDEDLPF